MHWSPEVSAQTVESNTSLQVLSTALVFLTCDSTHCSLNASQVTILYASHRIATIPWCVDAISIPFTDEEMRLHH